MKTNVWSDIHDAIYFKCQDININRYFNFAKTGMEIVTNAVRDIVYKLGEEGDK